MSEQQNSVTATDGIQRFETRAPHPQNIADIFKGRWAARLDHLAPGVEAGPRAMFDGSDPRPGWAAEFLGNTAGSLAGMRVLEVGPLEGAHTRDLIKLGAEHVLAIESNITAFMKCLVVKELAQLPRCTFMLGDAQKYLQETAERFSLIYCSGVLYHMEDPFEMLRAMTSRTDKIFIWTHFCLEEKPSKPPVSVTRDGLELTYFESEYLETSASNAFWGGIAPRAHWMSKEGIHKSLAHLGFSMRIVDEIDHEQTPSFSFVATRNPI